MWRGGDGYKRGGQILEEINCCVTGGRENPVFQPEFRVITGETWPSGGYRNKVNVHVLV